MIETPLFYARGSAQLFAVLHQPASSTATGFVISHAFAEEKLWSHRAIVSCARALAQHGHAVLRFDYSGAGDSSGTTPETNLQSHLDDLIAAVQELTAHHPRLERIGLLGLRLGAAFAGLVCEQAVDDARLAKLRGGPLVLWEPVVDGEAYFQELLRSNVATQMAVYGKVLESRDMLIERIRAGGTVNVDGYEIGRELLETVGRTDLLPASMRHAGPTLIVQAAASEQQKAREDLQRLAASYGNGTYLRVSEQPFWREIKPFYGVARNLQQATLQWLEQQHV